MDQIIKNLADPSWWFTGVFFVVLGIVLTKLIVNWIPNLWDGLSSYFPERIEKFNRWNKKRILLIVKNNRQKDMKVIWLIGRYWSSAIVTTLLLAFIIIYFLLSKDVTVKDILYSSKFLILIPFYGLLLSVAAHKKTLGKVINAHHRWKRITKRSNGTREKASRAP